MREKPPSASTRLFMALSLLHISSMSAIVDKRSRRK
jgi:hypothetical protein